MLSKPKLSGTCVQNDATGSEIYQYFFGADSSQTDVAVGNVNFVGLEGTCTLTPIATVGGTETTFGQFTVDVIPGVTQVIDISGPTLTVQFPEPDFITGNPSITVTGTVTDDQSVAGVTVNGVDAVLVSTNNPNDPAEMSFSATVPLVRGPNEIVTVATDTANPANSSSDTRIIFRDEGPPVLNWTPADGGVIPSTGPLTPIQLDGTADDDAGIQSVTVNGQVVSVLSTNNAAKPNEVSFTAVIDGGLGDNFIEVVAMDISNRTTAQTHKVTVVDNRPPTADAGPDQEIQATGFPASVTLDGSLSTDPDGDALVFNWSGPFGSAIGVSPNVELGLGTHVITLTVTDPSGATATDTVTITVVPAPLALLTLKKAEVDWPESGETLAEVKLHGQVALPPGVSPSGIDPVGRVLLDLVGSPAEFDQTVGFALKDGGEKWEYKAHPAGVGLKRFSIKWKGAEFEYKGVVHLETEFISSTETSLSLEREGTAGPVSFTVNGSTVSLSETDVVSAPEGVSCEVDEDEEVTCTFPFPLTPAMSIDLTALGSTTNIPVSDHFTPAIGKFKVKANVDPQNLTGASRPATLDLNLELGSAGFGRTAGITQPQWQELKLKEWKAKFHD